MELKELGLTEYEAKAYEALAELGKSSASEISSRSGVSYGKIYTVLSSLEAKGLVKIIPEQTKKFIVTDPANLSKLIDSKEKKLAQLRKNVKKLKSHYDFHEKEVIEMAKGKKNFYKVLRDLPREKTFTYQIKWASAWHHDSRRRAKERKKKKIDHKVLTRYDDETKKDVKKWMEIHTNIKKHANKGVAIDIRDNSVMIALIKSNIIMSIKDKAFISMMKNLFKSAYSQAEKID